jgi:hypothetical protein
VVVARLGPAARCVARTNGTHGTYGVPAHKSRVSHRACRAVGRSPSSVESLGEGGSHPLFVPVGIVTTATPTQDEARSAVQILA